MRSWQQRQSDQRRCDSRGKMSHVGTQSFPSAEDRQARLYVRPPWEPLTHKAPRPRRQTETHGAAELEEGKPCKEPSKYNLRLEAQSHHGKNYASYNPKSKGES